MEFISDKENGNEYRRDKTIGHLLKFFGTSIQKNNMLDGEGKEKGVLEKKKLVYVYILEVGKIKFTRDIVTI